MMKFNLKNTWSRLLGMRKRKLQVKDIFDIDAMNLDETIKKLRTLEEALNKVTGPMAPTQDKELSTFVKAVWCQRQLDDLLLANGMVTEQLKKQPFNPKYLKHRDKVHHDINKLQPIVSETGLACAAIIEKQFGVSFTLLGGRDLPERKEAAPEETKTTSGIILPDQGKV